MKITQAIKLAQQHVYPARFGDLWVVSMPHKTIDGPRTHSLPRDYRGALLQTTSSRAELALELLGYGFETQYRASQDIYSGENWKTVVRKYHDENTRRGDKP